MSNIRRATPGDPERLHNRLRPADVRDCLIEHETTLDALCHALDTSDECYAVDADDGRLLAMFGVGSETPEVGIPWFLGTPEVVSNPREFMRTSRIYLAHFNARYHVLTNKLHASNVHHLRWVLAMGFSIGGHDNDIIDFARLTEW